MINAIHFTDLMFRGMLFFRVLQQANASGPLSFKEIVNGEREVSARPPLRPAKWIAHYDNSTISVEMVIEIFVCDVNWVSGTATGSRPFPDQGNSAPCRSAPG